MKGDPRERSVIVGTARQVLSAVLPGNGGPGGKHGKGESQECLAGRRARGLTDVAVVPPVALQR